MNELLHDPASLGVAGIVTAIVVALLLWKLVKLAFKVALFLAICAALAVGVGGYLKYGRVGLPLPDSTR